MATITKARPFILLYVNDFLSDEVVQMMDADQFSWYMRMLMQAWKNDPPCCLKNDEESLMIAAKCSDSSLWQAKSALVMRKWKHVRGGKYVTNNRLQEEFAKMCCVSEKRKKAAHAMHMQKCAEQNPATQIHIHTQTKPKSKPSAKATPSTADPRFDAIKKHVEKCCKFAKVPFVWDGSEAAHLARWLKGAPDESLERCIELVKHRFRLAREPGERPRKWIGDLGKFAAQGNGNHGQVNKAKQRQDESNDAILQAARRRVGEVDGGDESGIPEPDHHGRDSGDLPGRMGASGKPVGAREVPGSAGRGAADVEILSPRGRPA